MYRTAERDDNTQKLKFRRNKHIFMFNVHGILRCHQLWRNWILSGRVMKMIATLCWPSFKYRCLLEENSNSSRHCLKGYVFHIGRIYYIENDCVLFWTWQWNMTLVWKKRTFLLELFTWHKSCTVTSTDSKRMQRIKSRGDIFFAKEKVFIFLGCKKWRKRQPIRL